MFSDKDLLSQSTKVFTMQNNVKSKQTNRKI